MGLGGDEDKMENGGGGGGFFESFKVKSWGLPGCGGGRVWFSWNLGTWLGYSRGMPLATRCGGVARGELTLEVESGGGVAQGGVTGGVNRRELGLGGHAPGVEFG